MRRAYLLALLPGLALAGGSNYGVAPGSRDIAGRITEWAVPTPRFARDPAPGPDGSIYISVMNGDRIARFDPRSKAFREWDLPDGARPHGLVVAKDGTVFYTGNGDGSIGELDPASGKVIRHFTPSRGGNPHTPVLDAEGNVWFTGQGGGYLGRLERKSGKITEIPMPAGPRAGPYAVTVDGAGRVWANEIDTDTVAMLDPKTEKFRVFKLPSSGVGIRKAIVDAEGRYWYMGSHNGKLGVIE